MNLSEVPVMVTWPGTFYVFVEKVGPFMTNAPAAWGEAYALVPELMQHNKITGYMSLYKAPAMIYRAGFALEAPPSQLPAGLTYELFPGGKYGKFRLTGPYTLLGEATGRVFEIVEKLKINVRDDFNIENYVNNPRDTPAEQLVTEILIPVK